MRYQVDPTKIDLKDRKRMVFKDFMGVDALSPVFSISNKRASKMCNLISRDGSNHKRYGWEQYLQFNGAINGVFGFIIHNTKFSVVYAGTTFLIKRDGIDEAYRPLSECSDFITNTTDTDLFGNRECKCYIQKDRAYFIGMGDFVVLAWDKDNQKYRFARVYNDRDTYIPTTTANISCEEQDTDGNSNPITYGNRYTEEDVNVLTGWRKNTIIGSQVGSKRTYQLDLLSDEIIDQDSISVKGYDYDSSNGTKSTISLHAKSSTSAKLDLALNNSLEDTDGKIYIKANSHMPIPSDYGLENAVTLLEGKYINNGETIFAYKLDYFVTLAQGTYTNIFGNERTIYYNTGWINVYVKQNNGNYQLATEKIYVGDSGTPFGITGVGQDGNIEKAVIGGGSYGIGINIEDAFTTKDINISSNRNDIVVTSLYGVNENPAINYFYYIAQGMPLVSDNSNTTLGYLFIDKGLLQIGTTEHPLYARSIAGEANLEVTFKSDRNDDDANKITLSNISTTFGIGGNALALFVSGYELKPHMDWWSKELDYTYFPSGNECEIGTSNSNVMGYQVLGDSSLAIFKQYSTQEPSVYIRSGTDTNLSQTDDGTLSIQTGGYYTTGKYMSKGVIAPKSIALMQGDTMVLTQDGVCALTIDANTSSISNRVFRERSRLIDDILKNHVNKEYAKAFVHDGKYYLCIDSDVYIADSRYTFTLKGDMTDSYNYEWWIWDNCPMHYIFENEDGELCFGTTDGRICKFYKGFEDIKKDTYDVLTFSGGGNGISIYVDENSPNFLEDGEEYYFKTNTPLYAKIDFSYVKEAFASYYNGKIVRKVVDGEVDEDNEYRLSIEKDAETQVWSSKVINTDTFEESNVSFQDTIVLDIRNIRFKVYQPNTITYLVASELYDAADGNSSYLNLYKWRGCYNYSISVDRPIDIVHVQAQNVAAYWYSPALDFGTNDYEKVMLYVTIATERHTNGQVIFGWETREIEAEITSKGMDTFDFEEVNFNRIALDTTWNTSYTRNLKCNFNFIMFRFESDNDVDCCVHQFTIGYKINHKNRGVR